MIIMYCSTSERLSKCEAHFSENPDGGDCNEICLQCGLCEFLSENGSTYTMEIGFNFLDRHISLQSHIKAAPFKYPPHQLNLQHLKET